MTNDQKTPAKSPEVQAFAASLMPV